MCKHTLKGASGGNNLHASSIQPSQNPGQTEDGQGKGEVLTDSTVSENLILLLRILSCPLPPSPTPQGDVVSTQSSLLGADLQGKEKPHLWLDDGPGRVLL